MCNIGQCALSGSCTRRKSAPPGLRANDRTRAGSGARQTTRMGGAGPTHHVLLASIFAPLTTATSRRHRLSTDTARLAHSATSAAVTSCGDLGLVAAVGSRFCGGVPSVHLAAIDKTSFAAFNPIWRVCEFRARVGADSRRSDARHPGAFARRGGSKSRARDGWMARDAVSAMVIDVEDAWRATLAFRIFAARGRATDFRPARVGAGVGSGRRRPVDGRGPKRLGPTFDATAMRERRAVHHGREPTRMAHRPLGGASTGLHRRRPDLMASDRHAACDVRGVWAFRPGQIRGPTGSARNGK